MGANHDLRRIEIIVNSIGLPHEFGVVEQIDCSNASYTENGPKDRQDQFVHCTGAKSRPIYDRWVMRGLLGNEGCNLPSDPNDRIHAVRAVGTAWGSDANNNNVVTGFLAVNGVIRAKTLRFDRPSEHIFQTGLDYGGDGAVGLGDLLAIYIYADYMMPAARKAYCRRQTNI